MMHAVIVDDELNGLKGLELLLADLGQEVKVVGSTTDAVQAIELINIFRPDMVFLDISMPELDGFQVLERLRYRNFHLVFTTAHRQYALRALKMGASDYLLKPVDRRELRDTVSRVKARMQEESRRPDIFEVLKKIGEVKNMRILLPTKKSTEYVAPADIMYIEANSNTSIVSLINGQDIEVSLNLKEFEQQLCRKDLNFMRVHHSYIINVDYVSRYVKDEGGFATMRGKKTIPVSRQKKDEFLKLINFQP